MSIRFLLGRAGSGKTHTCLDEIRSRLTADPLRGPRLVFLVPEQASLQMERAILAPPSPGAASRAEVLSFRRLAHRILETVGSAPRRALSDASRAMVLRYLLDRHRPELRYYRRAARTIGLTRELGQTIGELLNEGVTAAEASSAAEGAEASGGTFSAKMHDVALLMRAYLAYLGDRRVDPSQQLELAREALPRCAWLAGAEVWVDGFASMSGQEKRLLIELLRMSSAATLALLCDPGSDLRPEEVRPGGLRDLFAPTRETLRDWQRLLRAAGLAAGPTVILDSSPPPRFKDAPILAELERSLFRGRPSRTSATVDGQARVQVVELPSPRLEVEYAVASVMRWVRQAEPGWRFRDIAIIARNLERYDALLSAALAARSIPFFIDRRRSMAHHPLIEFVRAITQSAADPYRLDVIRRLLKTGLTPLCESDADELENYLIEHGIEGAEAWRAASWGHLSRGESEDDDDRDPYQEERRANVNRTRIALVAWLDPLLASSATGSARTGGGWRTWIQSACRSVGAAERLARRADEGERGGRLEDAEAHRQVWREVEEFLEDAAFAFEEAELDARAFSDLLETGLGTMTLGLAPPMLDQVLVGSIERSRHPDLKGVILLGFNEGVLPARHAESIILSDEDRAALRDRGVDLGPSRKDQSQDERLLAYIALTRASERVLVTYSSSDAQGRELRPSPYLAELTPYLPEGQATRVGDPREERQTWDILTTADLAAALACEIRARPAVETDDAAVRGTWNALYAGLRARGEAEARLLRAFERLSAPPREALKGGVAARLRGQPLQTSVSALESYAACPFQHFARFDLGLRERAEARLTAIDVGRLHHAVLEDFVRSFEADNRGFSGLSAEEVESGLSASAARVAAQLDAALAQTTSRDAYLVRRMQDHLRPALRGQSALLSAGRARPRRAEAAFGRGGAGNMPALVLTTPAGRTVLLRGNIDRVDLAEWADEALGIVVDYKSGGRALKFDAVYYGLSLQLLAYLCALQEHGATLAGRPVQPLAALYVGLRPEYRSVLHPSKAKEDCVSPGAAKARGLIDFGRFEALAPSEAAPRFYQVTVRKDGAPGAQDRNDAVPTQDFRSLLELTKRRIGELADRMIDGGVEVEPRRLGPWSPCRWCAYPSVCGFESGASPTVVLEPLRRTEVLERIREDIRDDAGAE